MFGEQKGDWSDLSLVNEGGEGDVIGQSQLCGIGPYRPLGAVILDSKFNRKLFILSRAMSWPD